MTGIRVLRRLAWDRGEAEIWTVGAMLHHLVLVLEDGTRVAPFAEAPWHDDPAIMQDGTIAAHLRHLGGEWPCVPFGRTQTDAVFHGFGTDNAWSFAGEKDGVSLFEIVYPQGHPVERMTRTVAGIPGKAAVGFAVTAHIRAECHLPVGLHPVFAIPEAGEPFAVEAAFGHGRTFPALFEPGVSQLAVGARFDSLEALPLANGSTRPLAELARETTEEAAQIFDVGGRVSLSYPRRGYRVHLDWNPADFPTCLFWLSAAGRASKPWNGRFRGIGVEPLAASFGEDGVGKAGPGNGTRHFRAGETWTARYAVSAEPCPLPLSADPLT